MTGTQFGVGVPATYPVQQTPWGLSPYGTQVTPLQIVSQQIQQLQQLGYVQQQQLQQLQQWIQQLPFQTLPAAQQFFPVQPGHVM